MMKTKAGKHFFVDSFPPPKFLSMPAVGLDISDRRVRFLEFTKKSYGLALGRFGESRIPPGVVVSGKLKRPDELRKILKSFREKHGLKFVHVSLPEERAYLVKMEVPDLPDPEIYNAISFQLEEYVPVPAGDAVFDYSIIHASKTHKGYLDVAVSVLPKKEVQEYLGIFEGTGFVPVSFEIEAQAIARAVVPEEYHDTTMIVDFGRTRTGVAVVSEGAVRFTSTIDFGSEMITQALEKQFSISAQEAEVLKNKRGISKSAKDRDFLLGIMSSISILRDEINKLYIYWHTHREGGEKGHVIKKILLCGGGANLGGLSDYLSAGLRVETEVANPWVNVNSFDNMIPPITLNEALGYSAVIGLTLRSGEIH